MNDDNILVQKIKETQDNEACEILFNRHKPLIADVIDRNSYIHSFAIESSTSELKDQKYLIFWDAVQKYDASKGMSFSTFLGQKAKWACMKAKDTFQHLETTEPSVINELIDKEDYFDTDYSEEIIQYVLSKLKEEKNPRLLRAIEMKYLEGKQLAEIGAEFGVTQERARQIIEIALNKLKKRVNRRDIY